MVVHLNELSVSQEMRVKQGSHVEVNSGFLSMVEMFVKLETFLYNYAVRTIHHIEQQIET
ncbi:hypothetical protein N780_07585 [Pontibacillus chungwhensis BH030062]|uniref:Uncharacterized protein n=1 Tax=Pontibacillus chungwhensis BH030062 TaxID=1385513 RepID=A0A0A2V8E5_9BACI|nr:hypothetical protein N780_07585 [Pontibacillus chungwhensis BH030062]